MLTLRKRPFGAKREFLTNSHAESSLHEIPCLLAAPFNSTHYMRFYYKLLFVSW